MLYNHFFLIHTDEWASLHEQTTAPATRVGGGGFGEGMVTVILFA